MMLTQRLRAGLIYAAASRLGLVEFVEGSLFSAQGAMRS